MTTRSEIELLVQFSCLCGVGVCKVCDNLRSGIDRVLAERDARIAALEKALRAFENLIENSRGVVGLHLNGDEAPWAELRRGGRFEDWLVDFDAALAATTGKGP